MIKRIFSLLLCFLLAFSLCACNSGGNSTETPDISELQQPDTDAPAHEHLYHQSEEMLIYAHHAEDTGVALQADYFYGMALAPISSLRFCVDNILWLKGEGETVADIVSAAPFGDWDAIVGAGLGSPMPFFFEGLLFTFQGKNDEAAECYKKAEANSNYTEMDFNYLKSMSIDDLYALRNECVKKEMVILDEYTPKSTMLAKRTGAEFSPIYHAALAGEIQQSGDNYSMYRCFLNAVLCNPQIPDYYSSAALTAMQIGDVETADLIINDGLWAFPQNGEINYVAATMAFASGDTNAAREYLQTAKSDEELPAAFSEQCDLLLSQIGG